ncbi:hypothetical protein [Fulvivirga sediminis]|uniref:Uncharacterized protein n=1 Tax=Fulvivirga sediminis TaxID=2803949 RepID=A0A937JXN4_9BACT|nr:hypothetical protein [Fulvivirga sediminis]MBL3655643.1 hypothetical protein [Fulvivirga sediminis]
MTFKSPEHFHNKTGFIFHVVLALPLTAFAFLFLEIKNNGRGAVLQGDTVNDVIQILFPLVTAVIFIFGYRKFKKSSRNIKGDTLPEKLSSYFDVTMKFYIILGITSVILVLGLYLTALPIFILSYVFLLFFMSLQRPTPQKYVKDLPLRKDEREVILHKGSFAQLQDSDQQLGK